jgi:hypothetical protein
MSVKDTAVIAKFIRMAAARRRGRKFLSRMNDEQLLAALSEVVGAADRTPSLRRERRGRPANNLKAASS